MELPEHLGVRSELDLLFNELGTNMIVLARTIDTKPTGNVVKKYYVNRRFSDGTAEQGQDQDLR